MDISLPPIRYDLRSHFNMFKNNLLKNFTSPKTSRAFDKEDLICFTKKIMSKQI